ncbi:uncharacterized protein VNE69_02241 [Vairimorpha necatrix]|uniref:Uncharacterized protein n=1 Tax=Vairimorpha necatrix TaxID=6039 RepID=A0AAX4J9Z7_9MICR
MFLFISLIKCSNNIYNTNEICTRFLLNVESKENTFSFKMNDTKIDFNLILAEGNNEMTLEENLDPNMEILFEYLINGGDFELYKKSLRANNNSLHYDSINEKDTKLNKHMTLQQQLINMQIEFEKIKEECILNFVKSPYYKTKITFNKKQTEKINNCRNSIMKFFKSFACKISYYTHDCENKLRKLNFLDNKQVFVVLKFVKDVFNFIKPKHSSLRLAEDSLLLLYNFSMVRWKLLKVMDVIYIPDLLISTYNFFESNMPRKYSEEARILDDLNYLRNKFNYIYNKKDILSSRLQKICQIILEKNNNKE